jgi:hypothetical protein
METAEAEGGSTTKALENGSYESDTEDTVHVAAVALGAPLKRTGKKLRQQPAITAITAN